jgi:hypothetical protein
MSKKRKLSDDQDVGSQIAAAIVKVYVNPKLDPKFFNECFPLVKFRQAADHASALEKGLEDNGDSLALNRAAHKAAGCGPKDVAASHTAAELKSALRAALLPPAGMQTTLTQRAAAERFGVPLRTVQRGVSELKKALLPKKLGEDATEGDVVSYLDRLEVKPRGTPPLLGADEAAMFVVTVAEHGDSGLPMPRGGVRVKAKGLFSALAADEPDPTKRQRLEAAKGGRNFFKRAVGVARVAGAPL